jgi:putative hemolysin
MELLIVVVLILLNGVFAMSEMAVVSARRTRLQQWVKQGDAQARAALALHQSPNQFLSTIQIGITLIGILSGAVGEALIADDIEALLKPFPVVSDYREAIATAIVVIVITYLSLVIGELVPKRLALLSPERVARRVAMPMHALSRLAFPAVWLLGGSVDAVLRLLRIRPSTEPRITEEEIQALIEEGARTGVFLGEERDLLKNVIRLADRPIETLMTPRGEIVWLDPDDPIEVNAREMAQNPHARYPVAHGNLDQVVGIVHSKELLAHVLAGGAPDLRAVMRPPLLVPTTVSPLRLLELFRTSPLHIAVVKGAYGEVKGVVTLHDVLEAIVGALPTEEAAAESRLVRREDGSWLMDGLLGINELKEALALTGLPDEEIGAYETAGGFVLTQLGRVPAVGDHVDWGGWRFEVVDMDGRRIDRILVSRHGLPQPPASKDDRAR